MNILIAEDETPILNGLKKLIPWRALGISRVLAAENGEQALELCRQDIPDILLTDIQMPKKNGLELAQELRNRNPNIKIIFLSSYDEKEYYKVAIKLHAIDFIEKPIRPEILTNTMRYVVNQIKSSQSQSKDFSTLREILRKLLREPKSVQDASVLAKLAPVSDQPGTYKMLYLNLAPDITNFSRLDAEARFEQIIRSLFHNGICVSSGSSFYGLIWKCGPESMVELQSALCTIQHEVAAFLSLETVPFVAAGAAVTDPAQIQQAIFSVNYVASQLFLSGYGTTAVPSNPNAPKRHTFSHLIEKFGCTLFMGEQKDTLALLQDFQEVVPTLTYHSAERIKVLCGEMFAKLKEISSLQGVNLMEHLNIDGCRKRGSQFATFNEFYHELVKQVRKYYNAFANGPNDDTVSRICNYIMQNYASPAISTDKIAKALHLSTTHICHLFKKARNEPISTYLNKIRIEKSKVYLLDGSIPLYEVASLVGYNDPNYYMRIFKRMIGTSPSAYRKQNQDNQEI